MSNGALEPLFTDRLAAVGGETRRCGLEDAIGLVLTEMGAFPGQPVVYTDRVREIAPGMVEGIEAAGVGCLPASVESALTAPVALSTAELAIAETGSVITADRTPAQRAAGMLSACNMVLVPAGCLVAGLDEAADWLQRHAAQNPYVSFITGPSRSADIERTLTIGVQGPSALIVVFLDGSDHDHRA